MLNISRRDAIKLISTGALGVALSPTLLSFTERTMLQRAIPSSNELLPIVGLGTWQTFDVQEQPEIRKRLLEVLYEMHALGGRLIDSSPMYGHSEKVIGELSSQLKSQNDFFYATKVWTRGKLAGIEQMQASFKKMQRQTMDLMQIHNLEDWQVHIKTLRDWKASGKIRYWGLTHYTNASHEKLGKLIKQEQPDFVQFNYSIDERHAEERLLNIAKDQGTAVIINRPYKGGQLFRKIKGKTLPDWCEALDIKSWGQYFLKYIISHPAVTCVIPGTSKPKHVIDNMMAGHGKLPDNTERQRMLAYLQTF